MKNWKNPLAILALILGLSGNVKGAGIRGFIHDSHDGISGKNCPVKIYRKPTGPIDTIYTTTDPSGKYSQNTANFNPEPSPGDTLYIEAEKDTLSKTYTAKLKFLAGNPYNLEITLDDPDKQNKAFTVSLGAPFSQGWIRDTSGLPDPIQGVYWLGKNPGQKCTTQIDTGYTAPTDHYWRGHVNFEKQDSIAKHGDSAYISLEKTQGNTTWHTLIPFTIDTTWGDAMKVADTVWFPLEVIVNDTTPPEISNATEWQDTTHKGPFEVSYDRSDGSGILSDSLIYKVNQGTSKTVPADSVVGDKAYCTIDTIVAPDDSVHYKVKSIDASANTNVAYWPASGWYSFKINSIGTEESQPAEKSFRVSPNPFYSNASISYPIEKAELNIYDVSGRLVDEVQIDNYEAEWGKDASKGIYFVKPKLGTLNGKIEVKKKVWKLIKL